MKLQVAFVFWAVSQTAIFIVYSLAPLWITGVEKLWNVQRIFRRLITSCKTHRVALLTSLIAPIVVVNPCKRPIWSRHRQKRKTVCQLGQYSLSCQRKSFPAARCSNDCLGAPFVECRAGVLCRMLMKLWLAAKWPNWMYDGVLPWWYTMLLVKRFGFSTSHFN